MEKVLRIKGGLLVETDDPHTAMRAAAMTRPIPGVQTQSAQTRLQVRLRLQACNKPDEGRLRFQLG